MGIAALNTNLPARCRAQNGMTLVELVITIVIIGIASAALFSAMAAITGRSADPMLRQQSLAIAEAYMEEISLQAFLDPGTRSVCPPSPAERQNYDNVCDYKGLSDPVVRNREGQDVGALGQFSVQVCVYSAATVPEDFQTCPAVESSDDWYGISSDRALRIDVKVMHPSMPMLVLSGYRTCYGEINAAGENLCEP